jgi:hypothetical protein
MRQIKAVRVASEMAREGRETQTSSRARTFCPVVDLVDWFRVIVDLERHGYTHRTLSLATGNSRTAIGGWRCNIHQPSHPSGEALVQLWIEVTEKDRDRLPRRTVSVLSAARSR